MRLRSSFHPAYIVILTIIVACSTSIRQRTELYPNKQLKQQWTEARDSSGDYVRHGVSTMWDTNGQILQHGSYQSGARTGVWVSWYASGRVKDSCTFLDDKPNGHFVAFHENGHKRQEGEYLDGRRQGRWIDWYATGTKEQDGNYRSDRKAGRWTLYYESSQKKQEATYVDGILDGLFTAWRASGLRSEEGQYRKGLREGIWTTWDENGLVLKEETFSGGRVIVSNDD